MKPMMLALMSEVMMLTLGMLGVSGVEALDCGDTLGPGGSFTLTTNVGPCTTPAGLFVAGPVTVDLNGHTVTCDTSGGGDIGIDIQGSGAVLKNGRVQACNIGVRIEGHTSQVRNVLADGNNHDGFVVIGAGHNTLTNNAAVSNGDDGFSVSSSSNSLTGNTAVGGGFGFDLTGIIAAHNSLRANRATDNIVGFALGSSSSRNTLSTNETFRNGFGIRVDSGSTHNIVSGNVALGNAPDLQDANPSCDSNTWTSNVFGTQNQACAH